MSKAQQILQRIKGVNMLKRENQTGDYVVFYFYRLFILLLAFLLSWFLISKIEFLNEMWGWVMTHFTEWNEYEDKFEFFIVSVIVLGVAGFGIIGEFFICYGLYHGVLFLLVVTNLATVREYEVEAKIHDKLIGTYRSPLGEPGDLVEQYNLELEIENYKKKYKLSVFDDTFNQLEKGQMIQVTVFEYLLGGYVFNHSIVLDEEEYDYDDKEY